MVYDDRKDKGSEIGESNTRGGEADEKWEMDRRGGYQFLNIDQVLYPKKFQRFSKIPHNRSIIRKHNNLLIFM
jgi:hypothetical protein